MNERHPTEAELLDAAEGASSAETTTHVAGCPACSAAIADLRGARTFLRAAPPVDPPRELLRASVRRLPARPRRRALRLAAVLLPAAAAAVAAGLLATGGGDGGAPTRKVAPVAPQADALRAEAASPPVAGPAREVAALLRRAGLRVLRVDPLVVVVQGEQARVDEALRGRPPGPVSVVVR